MTSDEMERMKALCQQIELEKDHAKFSQLLVDLNDLLEQKNQRLDKLPNSKI
jgi:hypothetical protein